jgi:serine/threonine protein kinase
MSTRTAHGVAGGWTAPGFTEQRELGHGASGRVTAAVHDRSGHRVAVKYLSPALVGDPVFMRRFRAEAPHQRHAAHRHGRPALLWHGDRVRG